MSNNKFLFLYPIESILNSEIKNYTWSHGKSYKQKYIELLNQVIDNRYRKKNFQINFAIHSNTPVSKKIELDADDVVIDLKTKASRKYFPYPNFEFLIDSIMPVNKLVVAGFHYHVCTMNTAKTAYNRGIDVVLDADLTEKFAYFITKSRFEDTTPNSEFRKLLCKLSSYQKQEYQFEQIERPWLPAI